MIQATFALASLRIADLLVVGPKTVSELGRLTGTKPDLLLTLLRLVATEGIFKEVDDRIFAQTEASDTLRTIWGEDRPTFNPVTLADSWIPQEIWLESLRSGKSAFELIHGSDFWDYISQDPQRTERYYESIRARSDLIAHEILHALNWDKVRTVVDVGGGTGSLLLELLRRFEHLTGILVEEARPTPAPNSLHDQALSRLNVVLGTFFEDVPPHGDVYILSRVLHDWSDEEAQQILNTVSQAMDVGTRLLIVDRIAPETDLPDEAKYSSVRMMLLFGGRERTLPEIRGMLLGAELEITKTTVTTTPYLIVEAVRR